MPCRQVSTYNGLNGSGKTGGGGYTTEADCNQACKEGACCEGTTCSVKPACQCQGTGQVFKGVGTTCADGACTACYGCMAQHPTYMTVTFSQTAPISGGYHELLIDLSGSYSLPSYNTAYPPCWFCGNFTKKYANAIVNQYGTFDLYVSFYILTFFGETSKSIGIAMYGASLNAGDTGDRRAGLYQFSVATGAPINIQTQGCIGTFVYPNQQQPFTSCDGNSHQASRFGWTTAEPLNGNQYRIAPNSNSVVCGSFSWSKA